MAREFDKEDVYDHEHGDLYIQYDPTSAAPGWFVMNDHGRSLGFASTKWGARRLARRILRARQLPANYKRERVTL